MSIKTYSLLLQGYRSLPKPRAVEKTYLELAGYPYLENVASNLLEFFLYPEAGHGLGTVMLEALLEAAGYEWEAADLQNVSVERESTTDSRQRMDLVVSSETLVIGVENKLFAELQNDFRHYQGHLRKQAVDRRVVALLLSLYPVQPAPFLAGFTPLTHADLFCCLLPRLGRPLLAANPRYTPLLFDFITTIEHLKDGSPMENEDFRTWLGET